MITFLTWLFFSTVKILVIASIFASLVKDKDNAFIKPLNRITDIMYAPFRKLLRMSPISLGSIDWSPLVVFALVLLLEKLFS